VREFEKDFAALMHSAHRPVLDNLRAGKFEDADVATIKKVATDLAAKY
jgi:F-type H+-transporting ATPase subunit alpha